jgi:3',5'-cyclic AMP phosphodiesterase CpdA
MYNRVWSLQGTHVVNSFTRFGAIFFISAIEPTHGDAIANTSGAGMKLVQFTDFHLRLSPPPESQFHVQPFWRGESQEMFARIAAISHDADAILFTGDATHGGGKREVAIFFDLLASAAGNKPVFMVVGNHDVVDPNWEDHFRRGIEQYRNFRLHDELYTIDEIDIVLINNQYLTRARLPSPNWLDDCFPVPAITEGQATKLDLALSGSADRPAIVLVHCPTHVLPATLFDFGASVLSGMDEYCKTLHAVLDKHPRARLVLSGHVHFNSTQIFGHGRIHHSLASITEYPYQVRIIEINQKDCSSRLASIATTSDVEAVRGLA